MTPSRRSSAARTSSSKASRSTRLLGSSFHRDLPPTSGRDSRDRPPRRTRLCRRDLGSLFLVAATGWLPADTLVVQSGVLGNRRRATVEGASMGLTEAINAFNESTEQKIQVGATRDGRMIAELPRVG